MKIIKFLFSHTRHELHTALIVLVFAGAYAIGYAALWVVLPFFGKELIINFELVGYFVGCIGAGELARGFTKMVQQNSYQNHSHLPNLNAGSVCIGSFWLCMVLKWSHQLWSIPIGFIVGALFYALLAWAQEFDRKFWK